MASRSIRRGTTVALAAALAALTAALALPLVVGTNVLAQSSPQLAGCPVLPADDIWNSPVDTLPVDPSSDAYIASIGADGAFTRLRGG